MVRYSFELVFGTHACRTISNSLRTPGTPGIYQRNADMPALLRRI